jgi:hypothetical protein
VLDGKRIYLYILLITESTTRKARLKKMVQKGTHSTIYNLKFKIMCTVHNGLVLIGCETWSLILREERRLRVFENRVLWRIFGPKNDEGTGE